MGKSVVDVIDVAGVAVHQAVLDVFLGEVLSARAPIATIMDGKRFIRTSTLDRGNKDGKKGGPVLSVSISATPGWKEGRKGQQEG